MSIGQLISYQVAPDTESLAVADSPMGTSAEVAAQERHPLTGHGSARETRRGPWSRLRDRRPLCLAIHADVASANMIVAKKALPLGIL